jgi:hypothetical protein
MERLRVWWEEWGGMLLVLGAYVLLIVMLYGILALVGVVLAGGVR